MAQLSGGSDATTHFCDCASSNLTAACEPLNFAHVKFKEAVSLLNLQPGESSNLRPNQS
ncbi:hypothetical protein [Campylobacter rectus]